jgi:site-specific recombinase XerD
MVWSNFCPVFNGYFFRKSQFCFVLVSSPPSPPTVKQHMAAIRMLFSWLTEKGVLAMNPAREVKTERFSRTEGKTPAFVEGEVQKLLNTVGISTHTGLHDRALLGVLAYTFARIGAVVNLKVEDYSHELDELPQTRSVRLRCIVAAATGSGRLCVR